MPVFQLGGSLNISVRLTVCSCMFGVPVFQLCGSLNISVRLICLWLYVWCASVSNVWFFKYVSEADLFVVVCLVCQCFKRLCSSLNISVRLICLWLYVCVPVVQSWGLCGS